MAARIIDLDWSIHLDGGHWPTSKDRVFIAAAIQRLGHLHFEDWTGDEARWANHRRPPFLPGAEVAFAGEQAIQDRHDEFALVVKSHLSPAAFEIRRLMRLIEAQAAAGDAIEQDLQDQVRAADLRLYREEDRDDPITRAHWDEVWWEFLDIDSVLDGAEKLLPRVANELVDMAQASRLKTYARPKGGGEIIPLAPYHWEIDPDIALQRLASCSINPTAHLCPEAPATHWIFVDEADLNREMQPYDDEQKRIEILNSRTATLVEGTREECAAWLMLQFDDPECPWSRKEQFFENAKRVFGALLSENCFLEAWKDAVVEFPSRSKPGPRTEKANSTN